MHSLFRSVNWFTATFMLVLFFDIILSNIEGLLYYSVITKGLLFLLLVGYFHLHGKWLRKLERGAHDAYR